MLLEHDRIVLTANIPEEGLKAGDVGVIVHIHPQHAAYEVEFFSLNGNTVTVATVMAEQARAVTGHDVTHARSIKAAV